jgi:small subunit ribosomal protein S1
VSLKQLEPHPWDALSDKVKAGDKVGEIWVVIADYGAFVEIEEGVEVLSVSDVMVHTLYVLPGDFVK